MFKKLLKYDMSAVAKFWWIGAVVSLVSSLAGALFFKAFFYIVEKSDDSVFLVLFGIFCMFAGVLCVFTMSLSIMLTIVLVFSRFYKHFFSDEGYLTFTLPVSRRALFLSKTVNAVIWYSLHTLVLIFSFVLFFLLIVPTEEGQFLINPIIFESIGKIFSMMWEEMGVWLVVYAIEGIILLALSTFFGIALIHFCITVGSLLVKKAKVILSIGIYYACTSIFSVIGEIGYLFFVGLISSRMSIVMENATEAAGYAIMALWFLVYSAIIAVISVAIYSVTQYLLDRKLNLA